MRNTAPRRYNSTNYRTNYGYMQGSAAPVFPQEEYPRYDRSGERVLAKRKKKHKPHIEYVAAMDEDNDSLIIPYQIVLALAIVLIFALCLLSINAKISGLKAEIREVNQLTQKCIDVNERLSVNMAENTDLNEVKNVASTRLGMQVAAPHQVVTINVPKDNNTIHYDDRAAELNKKTFLEKIGKH